MPTTVETYLQNRPSGNRATAHYAIRNEFGETVAETNLSIPIGFEPDTANRRLEARDVCGYGRGYYAEFVGWVDEVTSFFAESEIVRSVQFLLDSSSICTDGAKRILSQAAERYRDAAGWLALADILDYLPNSERVNRVGNDYSVDHITVRTCTDNERYACLRNHFDNQAEAYTNGYVKEIIQTIPASVIVDRLGDAHALTAGGRRHAIRNLVHDTIGYPTFVNRMIERGDAGRWLAWDGRERVFGVFYTYRSE